MAVTTAALVATTGLAAAQTAASDTSPVNLSSSIDMANGKAAAAATVVQGDVRFEVLTPEVIRMEYSPTGSFLDDPTFDIMDRNFTAPAYTSSVSNGWLTIATSQETLSYQVGSGPFSAVNTKMQLLGALPPGASANVTPTWGWECTFGQACQAGAAALSGGATIANNHQNYLSPPGFVAGLTATGADASWQVLGAPAGAAAVTIRYANSKGGDGNTETRTESLVVNGISTQVGLPVTANWDDWSTVTVPVTLTAGTNTVAVDCATGDSCNVNIDDIAVSATSASPAPFLPANPLGGYIRSYDSVNGSYSGTTPTCASCTANIPQTASGLLDKSGWYLLDDSKTAVWTSDGWVANRPAGDVQDGYLFGYGQDFTGALSDLAKLTGPAALPDESVFGNWFSQYHQYSTSGYQGTILPQFHANGVSLDDLSVDTDWKSPNTWNGWEWNPSLFPDPTAFTDWAKAQGIDVALNVHSAIATNDPLYNQAQDIAGNSLGSGPCGFTDGNCASWDWSNVAQAESYFATADPTQNSVGMTWLDWCCDNSGVFSQPGVTPDAWINHLTAQQMVNNGERGFDLSRIGASYQDSQAGSYPSGPWADHRSVIAFTGDTEGTWDTLVSEAKLSQDEGSIGEPFVSDDIGSFLGSSDTGNGNDPDDLYLRWLQLGTFQPIMREHSNNDQNPRLPWEYDAATQAVGDQFLQLREQLVPYLYTLAQQASSTGLPMTQALYLNYPGQAPAYTNPTEYTLGSDVLVAPVTTPGASVAQSVWFPPGTWQDYFTGATFTGPGTFTINVPTSRMPVFVKDGGIIPLQPATGQAQSAGTAPITLQVHAGADGSYSMYDDAGTGLGHESGQSTQTPITYTENTSAATSTLTIDPATGSYPGAPSSRSYTLDLVDESQPGTVQINGRTIQASQWSYDTATKTLQVPLGAVATTSSLTVTQTGGTPVEASEPTGPETTSSSPATAKAGQQVTVTGSGFGTSQGSSYLTFRDNGTNWGAPGDAATFTIDSWSDSAITFTVPQPSGANGEWAVTPGSTATVTVTTGSGTSSTRNVAIGSTTPPVGQVTGYQGMCLDDSAFGGSGTQQLIYNCNGGSNQQWTVESNGTLQALGMCLDVRGATATNGTPVQLYTFNNTDAQDWAPQPNGELVNPQSGKCLTDPASGPSGTGLVIDVCNGGANQDWTLPH